MGKKEKKEYKVVMDLLAEKIKIKPDLSGSFTVYGQY